MPSVLLVASEARPFSKTGGLADFMSGLPPELARSGSRIAVLIPLYEPPNDDTGPCVAARLSIRLGSREFRVSLHHAVREDVSWYFVVCPELYERPGIYADRGSLYEDNHVRFAVLSRVALDVVEDFFHATIIHANDVQTALVPIYLRAVRARGRLTRTRCLFSIHNAAYQGIMPLTVAADLGLEPGFVPRDALERDDGINLLTGAILSADMVSTVSATYALELQDPGLNMHLSDALRLRADRLRGIINGVDYSTWNPETDASLPARYSVVDLAGKLVCRRHLMDELNLVDPRDASPLVGMITRMADQKGFAILLQALPALLDKGFRFAILGAGDPKYELSLRELSRKFPERLSVRVGFDSELAHRITAGADVFLMPSLFEPCGLNQLYSLRYGTVPVVRATGGLNDTIDGAVGFKFGAFSAHALSVCLDDARRVYANDRARWTQMMRDGMRKDYSWVHTADGYMKVYAEMLDPE